ncbi:hypothetical protein NX02_12440 [Sphingomonas sanxanigenens DSM 19645 = NX02]|uniref:Uncharacterized protein n=2 Tax=Sphingomonas sanxanigenens TaxID=397260 RepID=W0A8D7_9SPHN|nr:hypothetical protein NX02_12440 [Sphingomonas sanxanigenens DSM 19645 = NX02]
MLVALASALLAGGCDDQRTSIANPMEPRADEMDQATDEWAEGLREEQRILLERGARGDSDAMARAMALEEQIDAGVGGTTDRSADVRDAGDLLYE